MEPMGKATGFCPKCSKPLTLALPPGGKGQRSLQCIDCDRPDPLKSEYAEGWLKGELVVLSQKVAGFDFENQVFERIQDWRARC
jgi:hypothetical protein